MKRKITGIFCIFMIAVLAAGFMSTGAAAQGGERKEVNVAFTHDLHSHLEQFYLQEDGTEKQVGGFARIMTFLEEKRSEDENLLVLDGGDFSMGTLYQTVFESQAAELRMLGFLGVDVTTLGNHEFDYRSEGLANMLAAAKESGDRLPELVVCNVDWEATLKGADGQYDARLQGTDGQDDTRLQGADRQDDARLKETDVHDGALLQEAFEKFGIKDYVMLQKGDVRIAVTGVFGEDSLACAPTCALTFREPAEAVKDTVEKIRENEDADMIVCVSHSGTWEDESESEDELLAKAVPQLDLIISGHTHSILEEPIIHGNTAIVSTGEYGAWIGSLKMVQREDGRWEVRDYELTLMDDSLEEDEGAQEKITQLGENIDREYLEQFGYTKDQILTCNPWQFTAVNGLGSVLQEETLGNLLADSYLYAVNGSDTGDENPAAVAVVPSGCIRDTFHKDTDVTVSDAFQTLSLGIGPDGVPGYPLVSIYLTGEELRTMAEVDASISPIMTTAQLYTSGVSYTLNPNRLILNKVTDVSLQDMDGKKEALQDEKLYRVVADLYSGQMLGAVSAKSYGILSITPKDAQGNEIPMDRLEDYIVHRNGQELKAWVCVADYLNSFEKKNGTSEIPEYYSRTQGRKVIDDDRSFGALIRHPNKIAIVIVCIAAGGVLLLAIMITVIVRFIKRMRRS